MRNAIFIAILFVAGCGQTKTVTYHYEEPSGVSTEETEVLEVRRPRIEPINETGDRISQPLEIRTYRQPVDIPPSIETEPIYEVEITGDIATFKGLERAIKVRLPARGETKTVRFDSSGTVQERVDGKPETQKVQEVVERKGNRVAHISRGIFAGPIRLLLVVLGLVATGLVTYLVIRFMPRRNE